MKHLYKAIIRGLLIVAISFPIIFILLKFSALIGIDIRPVLDPNSEYFVPFVIFNSISTMIILFLVNIAGKKWNI